jgi:hypothetical protein
MSNCEHTIPAYLILGEEHYCKTVAVEDIFRLVYTSRAKAAIPPKLESTLVTVISGVFVDLKNNGFPRFRWEKSSRAK